MAMATCTYALDLIENGTGESIDGVGITTFWTSILICKAQCSEQLESWADALKVWSELCNHHQGGQTAIQGKARCEGALGMRSNVPPTKQIYINNLTRVKELTAMETAEDDAKAALFEKVEASLDAWKQGKENNLRSLLSSLDTILWVEAGWKSVKMQELITPSKTKVAYMKAVAKVHPDKIPRNATMEQKMIATGVFSELNKAWDIFKTQNSI